jgi:hypothetical protein
MNLPAHTVIIEGSRGAMRCAGGVRKSGESTSDGGMYVNMDHCYFAWDEFDQAIKSVRTLLLFCSKGFPV